MKKNGFTLTELLAVIIILGMLILIAVPSISNVIDSSRKSSYVSIAKAYVEEVKNKIAARKYKIKKDGVAYFIPIDIIDYDNGSKESPFGKWETFTDKIYFVAHNDESIGTCSKRSSKVLDDGNLVLYDSEDNTVISSSVYDKLSLGCYKAKTYSEAFVIVIYDQDKQQYNYYWTSRDVTGHVIFPKDINKISEDDIRISNNHVAAFEKKDVYGIDRGTASSPSLSSDNKFEVDVLNSSSTSAYGRVSFYLPDAEFVINEATLVSN